MKMMLSLGFPCTAFWTASLLLGAAKLVHVSGSPRPREVLINRETGECTITPFFGDECAYCFIRQGWESIGYDFQVTCPEGYNEVSKDASFCVGSRNEMCCSAGFSGYGDCDFLAFNEDLQKCTITLCMDLPDGWTRDPPDSSSDFDDGRCPFEYFDFDSPNPWVDPEDLACNDPCKDVSTCGDCIDAGCTWSFVDEICSPVCYDWETCLATPLTDVGISSAALCEETKSVLRDNEECEGKESCIACLATTLPSDGTQSCRWIDTCSGESSCEQCFASSCNGACEELNECQTTPLPKCVDVTFDKDADGNILVPGTCVENEWAAYGLALLAGGGEGGLPCLFDTANPVTEMHGDADLGAPNEQCPNGGPGIGGGGQPGGLGPNCDPLGSVLIIQEPGTDGVPDDNARGGLIVFQFSPMAEQVKEIGFLDVDETTTVYLLHVDDDGVTNEKVIEVPNKGNNSYQVVSINTSRVTDLVVDATGSFAVTSISFCYM